MSEPRQYWIDPIAKGRSALDQSNLYTAVAAPRNGQQFIHVIEMSAYEKLQKDHAKDIAGLIRQIQLIQKERDELKQQVDVLNEKFKINDDHLKSMACESDEDNFKIIELASDRQILLEALEFYANLDWKVNTETWQQPAREAIKKVTK